MSSINRHKNESTQINKQINKQIIQLINQLLNEYPAFKCLKMS